MGKLYDFQVSFGQVSILTKELDTEFKKWRERPLPDIKSITLDATYYKVCIDGVVRDYATLIVIGMRRDDGQRMILEISCALSEAEVHCRNFNNSLRERGIGIPDLVTSDAHNGLRACLSATPWQRCQFHLQKNAQQQITKQELKSKVATDIATDIATIFNAADRPHAEARLASFIKTYSKTQPKLAEDFTVLNLPAEHCKNPHFKCL